MEKRIEVRQITAASGTPQDLYAARRQIYTRTFTGLFRQLRITTGGLLLSVFFGTVWLQWQGRQAVWWDLPARQFHVFGATFWPQDFILLSGLLIVGAFALFFVTVHAGRVWCGYSCPQSVWTWIFMWCEKVTEGDRLQRIKLDRAPLSLAKVLRKTAKHGLWLAIALGTGLTFVGYFVPIRELLGDFFIASADPWAYFWAGLLTLTTYLLAGWLREQVCIHMCPYARFQSVMFDQDTLIVSYDSRRGEPHGPRRKDGEPQAVGLGDCIDCTMCVQVCPTGIDIRQGLQIECIGCAACIDACDSIMDKMAYPRGLISYTTEHALSGGTRRTLRPRLIAYGVVLLAMLGLLANGFMTRPLTGLDVSKDRLLYRENSSGRIENVYSISVINKDQRAHVYVLHAEGLDGLQLHGGGEIQVAAGDRVSLPVRLSAAAQDLPSPNNAVTFFLRNVDDDDEYVQTTSRFTGPKVP